MAEGSLSPGRWTLQSLAADAAVGAEVRGEAAIGGLAYDPASVRGGELFCCIPGARVDGHSLAADVVARGAAALCVERWLSVDVPQAKVGRVRDAMGPLAATFFMHPSREMSVAAVTGTNGKTTVTYLLEAIGRAAGREVGVIGTVARRFREVTQPAARNTPEAVDLQSLLRTMCDAGVDLVALEATSDGLEQGRLRATRVATAGFTNLTQDHMNTHGTMEAYFEAKAELFDSAYTSRAVINVADDYGRMLHDRARGRLDVLSYGTAGADIDCLEAELRPDGSRARFSTPAGSCTIETSLVGRYNLANCMCAIGMSLQLGFSPEEIREGIGRLDTVAGRLEPIVAGQSFLVLVDYAHTPDALEQALRACRELADGRVIAVFGCGGDRDRAKRPVMGAVAARLADVAIITSDNPRSEPPLQIISEIERGARRGGGRFMVVPDRREAIAAGLREAGRGDVVLIAGKGHEQGQQLAEETVPFDDRIVARELLGDVLCRS